MICFKVYIVRLLFLSRLDLLFSYIMYFFSYYFSTSVWGICFLTSAGISRDKYRWYVGFCWRCVESNLGFGPEFYRTTSGDRWRLRTTVQTVPPDMLFVVKRLFV